MTLDDIAQQLHDVGFALDQNFLDQALLELVRVDFDELLLDGKFQRARIGAGRDLQIKDDVRSDQTCWFDSNANKCAQNQILAKLEGLRQTLNQKLFLGLKSFAGHYSIFPINGFYQRHLDSFSTPNERKVSVAIYLNKKWKPQDGGQLRIYHENGFTDVVPEAGTMVCFLSQESQHEVLTTLATRRSFAGWFS